MLDATTVKYKTFRGIGVYGLKAISEPLNDFQYIEPFLTSSWQVLFFRRFIDTKVDRRELDGIQTTWMQKASEHVSRDLILLKNLLMGM